VAGKRLGLEDTRGTLFYEIARIAKQKRPRYLLLENVRGLLFHDRGRTFTTIIQVFYELGYDLEWQVINSKYFVPQNRERIFIVGHLRGEPTRKILPIGEINPGDNKTRQKTQGERQRIFNTLDSNYAKGYGSRTMIYLSQTNSNMKQRIQNRKESWTLTNNCADFGLIQKGCLGNNSQGNRVYDTKGISTTLASNAGGKGAKTGLYEVGDRIRRLTPLECERLQGFPDGWTQGISDTQRYKCLGNAVTVPVVEYILDHFTI
jgi:DNA (cytosine-5)-methyltransferase 1